jgi:hypothetical protein
MASSRHGQERGSRYHQTDIHPMFRYDSAHQQDQHSYEATD